MKKRFFQRLLCSLLALCFSSLALANAKYQHLYVFGDSLTDNGNLYAMTYYRAKGPLPNPQQYFNGRFSNGLVWIEYLAPMMNLPTSHVVNLAYGGAKSGVGNFNNSSESPKYPGLKTEVTLFLQQHPEKHLDNAHGLYIIWIGADNFLGKQTNPRAEIKEASRGLANAIVRLKTRAGAKHFMIINVPFLGLTPMALQMNNKKPGVSKSFNRLIAADNAAYKKVVTRLQRSLKISATYININQLFLTIIHHGKQFGFTNVTQPCYNLREETACKDPDHYLFWGEIHPTTATHKIIAKWIYQHYLR